MKHETLYMYNEFGDYYIKLEIQTKPSCGEFCSLVTSLRANKSKELWAPNLNSPFWILQFLNLGVSSYLTKWHYRIMHKHLPYLHSHIIQRYDLASNFATMQTTNHYCGCFPLRDQIPKVDLNPNLHLPCVWSPHP